MIKVIQGEDKLGRDWKIEIDGEIIEKAKVSSMTDHLDLFVWLDKTPKIFFSQKGNDFFPLLSDKIESIVITISTKNIPENEANKLFPEDFFSNDFINFINDNRDKDDDSSLFLTVTINGDKSVTARMLFLEFIFAAQFWKLQFSMHDYLNEIRKHLVGELREEKTDFFTGQFQFVLAKDLTLQEIFDTVIQDLDNAFHKAFEELSQKTKNNSLITRFFSFPEEVRVPCEQYLLYFTEFLKDLGINSTADIKHEAGEILFSVTPNNPTQALDKIRVALEIFLSLPKKEIIIIPDEEFEIAMLKAKANIDHLNSQLSLAKAEIRVKEREIQAFEATLESKDISIEFLREKLNQQKRLLNGEIAEGIIDAEPKPKDEDREEFFDGVFALTQYEEKGVRVNLAQLYRKLKTYLKGE